MKKIYFLLFSIVFIISLNAQQASRFTQSADDFGLDNPAGLSFEDMRYQGTTLNANVRSQWWSDEGYPRTQALSWLDTRRERYHWGGAFIADQIGATNSLGLQGRYAHTIAKGVKIGISATGMSQKIDLPAHNIFDTGDPVAAAAGDTRWWLGASAGVFYSRFDATLPWNWFAGVAFRHILPLNQLPGGGEDPTATDFLAQGGIGWSSWWLGGRLRLSLHQPAALDVYARKYLFREKYFLGAIATSDTQYQTAGIQFGMEQPLRLDEEKGNHVLAVSLGFSKPLSSYVQGNTLIFDGRIVWIWEREKK